MLAMVAVVLAPVTVGLCKVTAPPPIDIWPWIGFCRLTKPRSIAEMKAMSALKMLPTLVAKRAKSIEPWVTAG